MSTNSSPPAVSIVIPYFNPGPFLAEAITSVLDQDFENWELHLVDDGSTDDSPSVARRLAEGDPRRIFCHEHPHRANRGAAASRNLGVTASQAPLLAFLDADDVWLPGSLAHRVAMMTAFPDADIVCGATEYWNSWQANAGEQEQDVVIDLGVEPEVVLSPPALATVNYPLGVGPAPSQNALCIRREAFDRIGGFEPSFSGASGMYEDQAFMIKVYLACTVVTSSRPFDRYRQHGSSVCARAVEDGLYNGVRLTFLDWFLQRGRSLPGAGAVPESVLAAAVRARHQVRGSHHDAMPLPSDPDGLLSWRQRMIDPAQIDHGRGPHSALSDVVFAGRVRLVVGRLIPMVSGAAKLELHWSAVVDLALEHFVAVHVIDRAGTILFQADYRQDQGVSAVAADGHWRDARIIPGPMLQGAHAVAFGIYDQNGEFWDSTSNQSDWDGRRTWLRL